MSFKCHYCKFKSDDPEITFHHLFTHSTGEAAQGPDDPPSSDGLLSAASPVAAQPVDPAIPRGVQTGISRGWLRRHLGHIVF